MLVTTDVEAGRSGFRSRRGGDSRGSLLPAWHLPMWLGSHGRPYLAIVPTETTALAACPRKERSQPPFSLRPCVHLRSSPERIAHDPAAASSLQERNVGSSHVGLGSRSNGVVKVALQGPFDVCPGSTGHPSVDHRRTYGRPANRLGAGAWEGVAEPRTRASTTAIKDA